MAVTLMELMSSWSQLGVYSRLRQPTDRMQRFFGMHIGGPRENKQRGRMFMYRYFDHTRDVAKFRSPGTAPGIIQNQVVGQVSGAFGRVHQKKVMEYEQLGNMRPIELNAPLDPGGQQYITRQQKHLHQQFANAREVAVAGVMRGSLGFVYSGEDLIPVLDGTGDYTITFNVPSTNTGALKKRDDSTDILTATWANASTKIIDNIVDIEQASEQRTGRPIRHIWTDSKVWNYVLNNTQVQQLAGTASTGYASWEMVEEAGPDGLPERWFVAVIKGYPHIQWHIYNSGLNINGVYTPFFDGTKALFIPEPDGDWIEMGVGSEFVVESPGREAAEQQGFFAWGKTSDEPAAVQLLAVDNFMPFLYVPKCVHWGTVVF